MCIQNFNAMMTKCNDCNAVCSIYTYIYLYIYLYIEQTGRRLKTRVSEHRSHINRNTNSQSVITEHRINFEHDFDWENVEILDTKRFLNKRLISKCLHIHMQENALMYDQIPRIFATHTYKF